MVLLILLVCLSSFGVGASEIQIKREILALWDSTETDNGNYVETPTHMYLEPILNHYGLKVTYVDVGKAFPLKLNSQKYLKKFRGIISWFSNDRLKDPKSYQAWLVKASQAKVPFLFLGYFGFLLKDEKNEFPKSFINKALNKFDIEYGGSFYNNPLLFQLSYQVPKSYLEFERGLENEVREVRVIKGLGKNSKAWLKIKISQEGESSWPVLENKKAFYVQAGYELFTNPQTYQVKWRVDPFKMVQKVFGAPSFPVPDITTLCGRRMLYVHIDGDGFINQSRVDNKSFSGDIVLEKIIKKYKVPTTASIIVSEINPNYLGNAGSVRSIRSLFSLPYVEPASHTFSHPLSWEMEPSLNEKKIYLSKDEVKKHRGPIIAYKIKDYILDYNKEITGAMEYIYSSLTDRSDEEKVVLWSGSCMPPEKALKITEKAGYLNMNGGDGRLDATYDSYAGLSPLMRTVGPYTQVYTSFANENIYTNLWTGPYGGFKDVVESFKRTESPIRMRPMNIYYHFYSGERKPSVDALEKIYDYATSQKISPVFASDYIKIVHGWRDSEIIKMSDNHFKFKSYNKLRTFRVDGSSVYPDYRRSKNIIGHNIHEGSLYVHLGGKAEADLYLTKKKVEANYIESCNGFVERVDRDRIEGYSRVPFQASIVKSGQKVSIESKVIGKFSILKKGVTK